MKWWRSSRMDFKGTQFEKEIILWGVRWYVAYPISYRQLEEMMGERGVAVDHSTLNRWVIKYAPEVEKRFRRCQRPVGRSWWLDETYVKIKGKSAYLYRAVDKEGYTIDFLLTPNRARDAAEAFLHKGSCFLFVDIRKDGSRSPPGGASEGRGRRTRSALAEGSSREVGQSQ
jgi:transposase-like protein